MKCNGLPGETYGMYSLGALEGPELTELREHLYSSCTTCEREVRHARSLWASIALATPAVKPRRAVRKRLVQSVGGGESWWRQPLAAFAMLCFALAGGWLIGTRTTLPRTTLLSTAERSIAFSPTYRVELPAVPVPSATPATNAAIPAVKQAPDPEQTRALAEANRQLADFRRDNARLEAELSQQKLLVVASQQSAQEAGRRYQAALEQRTPNEELQRRFETVSAHAKDLERQVATYQTLLGDQKKRLDQNLLLVTLVSDPGLRVVKMRATEKGRNVEGHALIAGNSQMAFYATGLPTLPSDRVYQLWLLRSKGQAIASAGLFAPDSAKRSTLQLRDASLLSGVTAIAVTDEPRGGSAQPTGHKWMVGS